MEIDILNLEKSKENEHRRKQSEFVVNLGLGANIFLAIFKVLFGMIGHSKALLADGVNSVSDVVYLIFVKIFVKLSNQPADEEHPYGHQQLESIAAVVIGAFVITTGISIFWDSINTVFDYVAGRNEKQSVQMVTLVVAFATVAIKIVLMLNAALVGKKTKNMAVLALSKDHRNDIFASAGAAAGIIMSLLGYTWVDPLAGAIVAIIIAKTGIEILMESTAELMDTVPSREIETQVREIIEENKAVRKVECVHSHKFGPYFVINITIAINGETTVFQADKIADTIESVIEKKMDMIKRVYVHIHPAK